MLLALLLLAVSPDHLPAFDGYVVDQAGIIDASSEQHLRAVASKLDHAGVAQIAVATISEATLDDDSIEDYAVALFKKWGLGHDKKRSDGVLVLFVPGKVGHRKIRIEVGYGLEGVLPDGKVGQIRTQQAFPYMKQDDYGQAAVHVVDAIAQVLQADAAQGGDAAPEANGARGGRGIGTSRGPDTSSSGGLLVTLLAMGGVVVALLVSASKKVFPGMKSKAGAAAASGVSLVSLFLAGSGGGWIAFILGLILMAVIWASIAQHRCPKCSSWMIIDEEITDEPTYWSEGTKHISQRCTKCRYRNEYDRSIPRKTATVVTSGGGYSGGGDSGGGSSDGFSGGGGGESGGGGASGEV